MMAKYLFQGSYAEEGLSGLLEEGGSKRRAAAEQVIGSVGGKVEAYYFAFGDHDFYIIADIPDNVSATAGSLVVNVSGAVQVKTVVLLTPEELDQAVKKTVEYRPPGE
jgi:uncharacterized protein with GYD domain